MRCHPEVNQLYELTDQLMGSLKRTSAMFNRPVSCKGPGCSACCYEPVYADFIEIDHALSRITPELRKRVKARTVEWLKVVEASKLLNEPVPSVHEWRKLHIACPFLENNECSIYRDRPTACRQHCAVGPVEKCEDNELRKKQEFLQSPDVDNKLAEVMFSNGTFMTQDNMGVFLAEILLKIEVVSRARRVWFWDKTMKGYRVKS